MPTLEDTIEVNGTGHKTTIVFERLAAPQATTGGVQSLAKVAIVTESSGGFEVTLTAGSYSLEWRINRGPINRLEFVMPETGGPYNLPDLVGEVGDGAVF